MRQPIFIIFISLSDVIRIHDMVISQFGGRRGIHNLGLLESAINHPWMIIEFGSDEDHEIPNLAAAYFFHIIKNHPFIDGNKRTGLLMALEFMYRNGFELEENFEGLYQLALDTATSKINEKEVAAFFKRTMKKID
jgi:death-on-curing protein